MVNVGRNSGSKMKIVGAIMGRWECEILIEKKTENWWSKEQDIRAI